MVSRFSNLPAVIYHDIFDYPLTREEVGVWKCAKKLKLNSRVANKVVFKNGYFYLKGRGKIIEKRKTCEKHSRKKLIIAKRSVRLISKIPTVLFVGITGALSMNNAGGASDIDLLIITKKNTLWTTRIFVYLVFHAYGVKVRSPLNKNEKDKLCLNMWLDETDLIWNKRDRNLYTAHEIAQVTPLLNKNETYEQFLWKNKWILSYWPKAVKINRPRRVKPESTGYFLTFFEKLAFRFQYFYMKSKITREVITSTRAVFHPTDWGKKVLTIFNSFG